MKPITAVVEVLFLALFLTIIVAICSVGQITAATTFIALALAAFSYALTTYNRTPLTEDTDPHVDFS